MESSVVHGDVDDVKSTSADAVRVTSVAGQPPPETREEITTRRWIILTLWAMVALCGLPAWYATTTVPRADLPLEAMNLWAEGHVSTPFASHSQ